MLKDLQGSLNKHHIAVTPGNTNQTQIIRGVSKDIDRPKDINRSDIDTDVACNIVGHIFRSIDMCLKEDKSKVKMNLFAKSFIKGILTNSVKDGIDNFIRNMNDLEVRSLLDTMQRELDKRK